MKKTLTILFLIGLIIWYMFIKKFDYQISFETKQAPGIIYSTLTEWNNWKPKTIPAVKTISKKPFSIIKQEFIVSDSIIDIQWDIEKKSDSITKVTAYLKDRKHSLYQRLIIPFKRTDFVKRSINTLKRIRKGIKFHKRKYKLSTIEITETPKKYAAYISLKSKSYNKANEMIKYNDLIVNFLNENNVDFFKLPFLEVTKWDIENDSIFFNFCFPILKHETFSDTTEVKIKALESKPALKITFNGNYRISDRAWFTLIDYASQNNIKMENLPLEFYKNNPHNGGDELEWETDVYITLKK